MKYLKLYNKISGFIYDVKEFFLKLRRSFAYAKAFWNVHDFDGTYTFVFIEAHLKRLLAEMEKTEFSTVRNTGSIRDIKICLNLIKRIKNDDYFDMHMSEYDFNKGTHNWDKKVKNRWHIEANRTIYSEKNDINYLFDTMKNIKKWWD